MTNETINDKTISDVIISMEEGIDIIKSAIDAIERRKKYKKAMELVNEDLARLDNISNESEREKNLKESRAKTLEKDIKKIDENLRSEIEVSIRTVELKIKIYIGKLVQARKAHSGIQKAEWAKITNKYSDV